MNCKIARILQLETMDVTDLLGQVNTNHQADNCKLIGCSPIFSVLNLDLFRLDVHRNQNKTKNNIMNCSNCNVSLEKCDQNYVGCRIYS